MTGPVVTTTAGAVEGTAHEGYQRYLGIPYAAPPVGALRFRPPAPPLHFDGVRQACSFAPHAPQLDSPLEQSLGEGVPMVVDEGACLALNVWTPEADAARRPVLFFVHGGAFVWGSSSSPLYDGARFATDHDVVVVSCNYRLGVLGFTSLDHLGPQFAGSGVAGVLDVVAALEWVRDNVERFGGDPGNVTVFGESAGAMTVATLLALRSTKGLVHKAILQSGAASTVMARDVAQARAVELCALLGTEGDPSVLQALGLEQVLEAQATLAARHASDGLGWCPVIDGAVLDRPPLHAVAAGAAADVPLLIGTNLDEWRLFSVFDPSIAGLDEAGLAEAVATRYPGDPGMAIATYRKRLGDAPAREVLECVVTDAVFRVPAVRLAEAQHAAGGEAWMYLFTWATPELGGALGSCHGLELGFVFNTLDTKSATVLAGASAPRSLAANLNATWAAFARHGDPSRGALGAWPRYEPSVRATMLLDTVARVERDPLAEERVLWEV